MDQTILLDRYNIPKEVCAELVAGIIQGIVSISSDSSFNPDSHIGPGGTSAVALAPSVDCVTGVYTTSHNYVPGSKVDQSTYRSKLAKVIAILTFFNILARYNKITELSVDIVLESELVLNQSKGNSP